MTEKMVEKIRQNSWLFLKRSISEMTRNDVEKDQGLTKETTVISVMFVQMSLELALIASLIDSSGISSIVNKKYSTLDESALLEMFSKNELITINFESLKNLAVSKGVFLEEDHKDIVDDFQKMRNKVVHLNYDFTSGDLYDLKYDLINFIVHVLIPILSGENENQSETISNNLDDGEFFKLIKFGPYKEEMHNLACTLSAYVYKCLYCGNDSLAAGGFENEYCCSCGSRFDGVGFMDYNHCGSKNSLAFDTLNIT